jgi:hypothetical protein
MFCNTFLSGSKDLLWKLVHFPSTRRIGLVERKNAQETPIYHYISIDQAIEKLLDSTFPDKSGEEGCWGRGRRGLGLSS